MADKVIQSNSVPSPWHRLSNSIRTTASSSDNEQDVTDSSSPSSARIIAYMRALLAGIARAYTLQPPQFGFRNSGNFRLFGGKAAGAALALSPGGRRAAAIVPVQFE